MEFDIKKSRLVYEVRDCGTRDNKERWVDEQLYKTEDGKYFIHFKGGSGCRYTVRLGFRNGKGRSGNFTIEEDEIKRWKSLSNIRKKDYPDRYIIINWGEEVE